MTLIVVAGGVRHLVADDEPAGPGDVVPPPAGATTDNTAAPVPPITAAVAAAPTGATTQSANVRTTPLPTASATPPWASNPVASIATPIDSTSTEAEADYFYDQLSPYGQWVNVNPYGPCWQPTNVPPDWRPYTLGHWVFSDADGWVWVSDEPFGWCTYHYGRWMLLGGDGWCWVPGSQWGPAWVVWRSGNDVCGWCPLPPAVPNRPITEVIAAIDPFAFVFVEEPFLADVRLREHFLPITRNVTFINVTKNITRIDRENGRFVNRGVPVSDVERITGRRIERFTVIDARDPRDVRVTGLDVALFRPRLPVRPAVEQPGAARTAAERGVPSHFEPVPAGTVTPADTEAARHQREAYYQRLGDQMRQRHERELAQPPSQGVTREQIQRQHEQEQRTFQQHMAPPNNPAPQQPIRRVPAGSGRSTASPPPLQHEAPARGPAEGTQRPVPTPAPNSPGGQGGTRGGGGEPGGGADGGRR